MAWASTRDEEEEDFAKETSGVSRTAILSLRSYAHNVLQTSNSVYIWCELRVGVYRHPLLEKWFLQESQS